MQDVLHEQFEETTAKKHTYDYPRDRPCMAHVLQLLTLLQKGGLTKNGNRSESSTICFYTLMVLLKKTLQPKIKIHLISKKFSVILVDVVSSNNWIHKKTDHLGLLGIIALGKLFIGSSRVGRTVEEQQSSISILGKRLR